MKFTGEDIAIGILSVVTALFVCAVLVSDKRGEEFPPRDICPNAYQTVHVNNRICRNCHKEVW